MKNRRPTIGARIVRGLVTMASRAQASIDYAGEEHDPDLVAAINYVWKLDRWFRVLSARRDS